MGASEAKAQALWAKAPPLGALVEANVQSNRRTLEYIRTELEEAERQSDADRYMRAIEAARELVAEFGRARAEAEAFEVQMQELLCRIREEKRVAKASELLRELREAKERGRKAARSSSRPTQNGEVR